MAGIAFVQENDSSVTGTSTTIVFNNAVSAGDTLFCVVGIANVSVSEYTVTVSDNINGSWTKIGDFFNQFDMQAELFWFSGTGSAAAGGMTVTISQNGASVLMAYAIAEYSGVGSIDVAATGTFTSGSSISCPNITTLNANDLILAALGSSSNGGTQTVSSPYNMRWVGPNGHGAFADQIVSTAGTYTGATFTCSNGADAYGIILAIKASSGPPSTAIAIDYAPGAGGVSQPNPKAIAW